MRPSRIAILFGAFLVAAGGLAWAQLCETGYRLETAPAVPPEFIFVDAVMGVDSDICGTLAGPCRSIQAAVDRVPMAFNRDVTVSIAPGCYDGGVNIVGRISPRMGKLTLTGAPGGVVITGPLAEQNGISVIHSDKVVLENLVIEGFPGNGVMITDSLDAELRSVTITGSQDGLFLGNSKTTIVGGSIENSLRHGINCEGGWLTVGSSVDPLFLVHNAASGLRADLCHASIQSAVGISGSETGMLAMNAGQIDLNMRGDVGIFLDRGQTGLTAEHHGMIAGYASSCTGVCTCTALNHAVCEAGPSATGGKNRTTIYDRNN